MRHIHLKEVDSTQVYLKQALITSQEPTLITSENQTEGKGRQGSSWTHFEHGLAFSFSLKANSVLTLTPLEIGVLLSKFFSPFVFLKWPNDLLNKANEKAGGIICQINGDNVMVGVGINLLNESQNDLFPYPVGGVFEEQDNQKFPPSFKKELPLKVFKFILENRMSATEVREEFPKKCAHINHEVTIKGDRDFTKGTFLGIGENGEALLKVGNEIRKFLTGSLSL